MSLTNFPNGVTSFGVPVLPVGVSFAKNAKRFFVDASLGSDGNDGLSVNSPIATIQKAVDMCTDGAGDSIFVAPGTYAENVVITSKDYISIIGAVIPGYAKPDVAPTTGIALNCVTSQGLVLKHMRFVSEDSDTVVNQGNGFHFSDCVFDGTSGQAATEANLRLVGNADDDSFTASEGRVIDCMFRGCGGDALIFQHANAPNGVGISDVEVIGCRFYGNTGDDIATAANTSGGGPGIGINVNFLLHECRFMSVDKTVYIDMDQVAAGGGVGTTNTGLLSGNWFADDAALDATKIDISGTNYRFVGNFNAIGVVDGSSFDN